MLPGYGFRVIMQCEMPQECPPRPRNVLIVCLATLYIAAAASPAHAWSTKEHILLTRVAAIQLLADPQTPAEMKAWLREALPGLGPDVASQRDYLLHARVGPYPRDVDGTAFWVVVPDLNALADSGPPERAKKVEPFGVPERALHFIDLEFFMADESRRRYRPDGSSKPAAADVPRDMADPRFARAGMLPFRVEQCYRELVESIRKGRLVDKPGQFPRDEHAAKWAGFLAHYVQDNTQPHHATEDYRSASYFAGNPRSAPNVHADMEYRLVDDEFADYPELRAEFWKLFAAAVDEVKDPVETDDLFLAALEVAMRSYDNLPLIGEAAAAAYAKPGGDKAGDTARGGRRSFDADAFFHFRRKVNGRDVSVLEMKAHQMAWAARRTSRLWLRAWREATAAAPPPPAAVPPAPAAR